MPRSLGVPLLLLGLLGDIDVVLAQGDTQKYQPGQTQALPNVPLAPPITTEPFLGYPPVTVDQRVVLQVLGTGNYEQLDTFLGGIQTTQRADIRREYDLLDAFRAFDTPDSIIGTQVDAWVQARPQSAHALLARATGGISRAWRISDRSRSRQLKAGERTELAALVDKAIADGRAALAIDPGHLIGYEVLLRAMLFQRDFTAQGAEFQAGYARNRGSHVLAHQFFNNLQPEYGGSHEAMAKFAETIAADSLFNPRLATMAGMMDAHLASDALSSNNLPAAMRHMNQALRYGREPEILLIRSRLEWKRQEFGRALADLNEVLAHRPQQYLALHSHGQFVQLLGNLAQGAERQRALGQAKTDYELILAIDSQEDGIRELLRQVDFELKECPEEHGACGGREVGFWRTLKGMFQDAGQILIILGVAAFVSLWNFVQWIRRKCYLPRYVHLLALGALLLVIVIDVMWVKAGLPMTMRRWMAIPFFPGFVYYLFIGFGGAAFAWKGRAR